MKESTREIVTAFLLVSNNKPVIFSSDEKKIDSIFQKATKKNIGIVKKKITFSKDRILQLGKNIFERKMPPEACGNPLEFRNKVIIELHSTLSRLSDLIKVDAQITWGKMSKKYGFESINVDDFSQWMLDINEYIKH
jgi:hypothetical protein